ncbi:hypothetical protein ROA7450_01469 [Roseovarius albus]|uniref:Uncharacterized protein n=1 Tax=Roseovarius albus TaxID=1247867 RepID=A0A1X6YW44_9RHOB|nr:hypothetical protein [Roseovarius albus]SLN32386.1 hypothetical protein ROA7450_01469 [Roseovarius albus]
MAGIVFLSILIGLIASATALLSGASIWFALFAYVACGVMMILVVVVLALMSNPVPRPELSRNT